MTKIIHDILNFDDVESEPESKFSVPATPIEATEIIQMGGAAPEPENDAEDVRMEQDFNHAMNNIKDVIDIAKDAAEKVFDLAKDTESDKMFSALNGLLKNVADTSKSMMDMHKSRMEYKERKKKIVAPINAQPISGNNLNIDKAVFVGTPDQLMDLMDKKKGSL